MIDETKSRIPIWLLWVRTQNNLLTLAAVTLTNHRARMYREVILRDPKAVSVEIEPSEANHLFHPDWDSAWAASYGEGHLEEYALQKQQIEVSLRRSAEYERDRALAALQAAGELIHEYEEVRCGRLGITIDAS